MSTETPPGPPSHSTRVSAITAENKETGSSMVQLQAEMHQGAIDAPHILKAYHDISPALMERVVVMAEKQIDHRHKIETMTVGSSNRRAWAGLACGLIITLSIIVLCAYMVYKNSPITAAIAAFFNVVGIVAVFVGGHKKDAK